MRFENEIQAIWHEKDEALREIRTDKCMKLEVKSVIEVFFADEHDSKRKRCLSHLECGSFDPRELKATSNLKSDLMKEEDFLICSLCAPSQKGLGLEGKLYPVQLAFHVKEG